MTATVLLATQIEGGKSIDFVTILCWLVCFQTGVTYMYWYTFLARGLKIKTNRMIKIETEEECWFNIG